jgi:hypothetical protein
MKNLLILIVLLPSLCLSKDVAYLGYKISIPDEYKVKKSDASNTLFFYIEGEKPNLAVGELKKGFFNLKDYGATSNRELLYLNHNDEIPSTNKNVLEMRRLNKIYPLQKQSISKNKDFVFFRTDNHMNLIGVGFLVSNPITDRILKISFFGESNEKFIKSVIDSLEVK